MPPLHSTTVVLSLWEAFVCLSSVVFAAALYVVEWPYKLIPLAATFGHFALPYAENRYLIAILRLVAKARNMKLKTIAPLPTNTSYIMGVYPHGYYPISAALHLSDPRVSHVRLAQSSGASYVPTQGWLSILKGNMLLASRNEINDAIAGGSPVALLPGGAKEMGYTKVGSDSIPLFRSHIGFLRIAFETSTPVVPVFIFGLYDEYKPPLPFFSTLVKDYKILIPLAVPTFMNREQHVMVTGTPLHPKDFPSIRELSSAFFDSLERLYEENKVAHGDRKRTIYWVDDKRESVNSEASAKDAPNEVYSRKKESRSEDRGGISALEIVGFLFMGGTWVSYLASHMNQIFSFSYYEWIGESLTPMTALHITASTAWAILARFQLGSYSKWHKVRGGIAMVFIMLTCFTGFMSSLLTAKKKAEENGDNQDWQVHFVAGSNMVFAAVPSFYVLKGLQHAMNGQRVQHRRVMKITYFILFAGVLIRYVSLTLHFIFGYPLKVSFTAGVALFYVLQSKDVLHSYSRQKDVFFPNMCMLLALIIVGLGLHGWVNMEKHIILLSLFYHGVTTLIGFALETELGTSLAKMLVHVSVPQKKKE